MSKLVLIYKNLRSVIFILAAFILALFFLITLTSVISRYAFDAPIVIADELIFYSFCYVALLAIYYAHHQNGHIRVDILISRCGERTRTITYLITDLIEEAIWLIFLWQGILYMIKLVSVTHQFHAFMLQVPVAVTVVLVPIVAFLIFIEILLSNVIPRTRALTGKVLSPD